MSCGRRILSTGLLNTAEDQVYAHIEVVNLSSVSQRIHFQVINWNSTVPNVILNVNEVIPPNTHRTHSARVNPFHYEVRVQHPGSPNFIFNHFAVNAGTATIDGLTFLQKDFMEITRPLIELT